MSDIRTVDLGSLVVKSVTNVFRTMLSMDVGQEVPPNLKSIRVAEHLVGSVGLAGRVMGNVNLFVSRQFAREMTAAMLGMTVEDVGSDEEVNDVIREVCNMVGGDLKSKLCDAGLTCSLSIPSITFGSNFKIEFKGWERHERLGFRNSHHSALFEIYLKSSN